MKIVLAGDHGGFELKGKILDFLHKFGYETEDVGPSELNKDDDYPDFVVQAIPRVLANPENKGIFLCRNGVGVCIMANKFKGIRAGLSFSPRHAASLRNDDNTNVLTLPADYMDEKTAIETVESWLKTPFSGSERHIRRLAKVEEIEK